LTKELIDLHHGVIDVESELGRGTTVRVVLPLGSSHLRADQIVVRKNGMLTTSPALRELLDLPLEPEEVNNAGGGERPIVLLIDDNEDMRQYVRSILGDQYMLFDAVNGEAGLNQARAFIPDLIISDVMMPVMDGYETCRRLKKDEKTSHIPVILLTAKTSLRSRIQGLETEADLYLSKPFVPQELLLNIHNLIQSRRKLRERYNRQVVLKPSEISINSTDELFLKRLMKVVEENYRDENFSVEQLSEEVGMSRSQLHRKLQALTNESASQFIRSFRLQRAMQLLRKNHASISEIAFAVGFSSHPYFNRCFHEEYGCTPSSVVEKEATSQ
jgi:DNA-binding response OmpR family regulator